MNGKRKQKLWDEDDPSNNAKLLNDPYYLKNKKIVQRNLKMKKQYNSQIHSKDEYLKYSELFY